MNPVPRKRERERRDGGRKGRREGRRKGGKEGTKKEGREGGMRCKRMSFTLENISLRHAYRSLTF